MSQREQFAFEDDYISELTSFEGPIHMKLQMNSQMLYNDRNLWSLHMKKLRKQGHSELADLDLDFYDENSSMRKLEQIFMRLDGSFDFFMQIENSHLHPIDFSKMMSYMEEIIAQ